MLYFRDLLVELDLMVSLENLALLVQMDLLVGKAPQGKMDVLEQTENPGIVVNRVKQVLLDPQAGLE